MCAEREREEQRTETGASKLTCSSAHDAKVTHLLAYTCWCGLMETAEEPVMGCAGGGTEEAVLQGVQGRPRRCPSVTLRYCLLFVLMLGCTSVSLC